MSGHDELRGKLSNTICNASLYPKRALPYLLGGDMSAVLDKTADSLLAAGYRKPRTITTTEELEALPKNSVVLDADTWVLRRQGLSWRAVASSGGYTSEAITLPVTVLYEPPAEAV